MFKLIFESICFPTLLLNNLQANYRNCSDDGEMLSQLQYSEQQEATHLSLLLFRP